MASPLEAARHAKALGACEAEGEAHRLRQMAGDRARLRRDPQRTAAPHLVAALADRILARGDHAKQGVEDGRAAGVLARARQHEAAGPIVEEGGIVDAQACPDDRVVLVAGGADRVEAAVRLLQLACGDIQLARGKLVLEQREGGGGRQLGAVPQRGRRFQPARPPARSRDSCRAVARRCRRGPRSCGT